MKIKLKIVTGFLLLSIIFFISCEPLRDCNEPRCIFTDVSTLAEVSLTGNLDSVINVGDTIRMVMNLPQVIKTEIGRKDYGDIEFGYLFADSYFDFISGGLDSLTLTQSIGRHPLNPVYIKYSTMIRGKKTWNTDTREFECLFIPKEKGRYKIQLEGGRIAMTDKDGKEWLINPIVQYDSATLEHLRLNQFLSWMEEAARPETFDKLNGNKQWYFFEAK